MGETTQQASVFAVTPADPDTLPLFANLGPVGRLGETALDLDLPRFAMGTTRVADLLADGEWHLIAELREVGGSSGDRRARELRDPRWGSLPIDVEPHPELGRGQWRYRLDLSRLTDAQAHVLTAICGVGEKP